MEKHRLAHGRPEPANQSHKHAICAAQITSGFANALANSFNVHPVTVATQHRAARLLWRNDRGKTVRRPWREAQQPPLTDGNVRWLWPKRERMRIWLTVRGYQIHKFPHVPKWDRPSSKGPPDDPWVPE